MRGPFIATVILLAEAVVAMRPLVAGDPPPAVVAEFSRRVQPLLLNRCATGGCHGTPGTGGLHIMHGDFTGRISRKITLANLDAVITACGPGRSPTALITTISGRHPQSATLPRDRSQPLTPREREILEGWLHGAFSAATFGATPPLASQPPNRLRKLLEDAANPPQLPPPQEPQGVILKDDRP